ncbi:MAG: hypothetical protein JNL70_10330 [Saprospiraceae bacterium]|nr:hypothetical protein [Saprospiraceae bacterium]
MTILKAKTTFYFYLFVLHISWAQKPKLWFQDNFDSKLDTTHWFCELKPTKNNAVYIENGQMMIEVANGATVWFKKELKNQWVIEFDRTVLMKGGANDRLSDFNLFWQASDPLSKKLFGRSPEFEHYDSLRLYYIGVGGNTNTTTRFRKYQGTGEKTILKEYTDAAHLLEANKTYHCRLEMHHKTMSFYVNDVLFFTYTDMNPYKKGYFGFRTTQSRHSIDNFKVYKK